MFALTSVAAADTGEIIEPQGELPSAASGFQAITCTKEEPLCSPETPGQFFTQAGGHPPDGFTQYIVQHENTTGKVEPLGVSIPTKPIKEPEDNRSIKTLRVDLPPGLTVNPNATPKCTLADFKTIVGGAPSCPNESIVGREEITLVTTVAGVVPAPEGIFGPGQTLPKGAVVAPSESLGTKIPVYNIQPKAGEPALFGFVAAGKEEVFLQTEVAWQSDFHESFKIELPKPEPPFATLVSRLVNFGQEAGNVGLIKSGNGTYINNPTTCYDPSAFPALYSTFFRAESYGVPNDTFPTGSTPFEAKVEESKGNLIQQQGCDAVPFNPGLDVAPGTGAVDSPAPATVTTTLDYLTGAESAVQESHLKSAKVTLPAGMGLNPSGSNGLVACTDAQFAKGQRTPDNSCPAASAIGTAEITSPPLAAPLVGQIYVGEQKSSDPESGEEFRILVEAKEPNEGIDVRLVGKTVANATTGQLTAVFNEQEVGELAGQLPEGLPQVPFKAVKLSFDGAHRVLTSPPTCTPATTSAAMEPWARPGTTVAITAKPFTLSSDPAGGSCPTTLAARKFAPTYTATSDSAAAGKYSPFRIHIARTDGQQELKSVNVTLPKGLTGKLAGIPYCSDAALAAASGTSGKAQIAGPSCSAASEIGTSATTAGTGATPVTLAGHAYLAGPYRGAPLSLAIITPAVSGPFDLGTVVVRVALNVDPVTAQINAVSDVIPDVFGGVKLDIRSINVDVSRSQFMLNPTSCTAQATAGSIYGGGANPAVPASFSSYAVTAPFQATGCNKLNFKPKFNARLYGPTSRNKYPRIRAILTARKGDANVARAALTLPHSLFLEQGHIKTICTRVQLAAQQCPQAAIYGHAEAKTPLLANKLKGPVYLVSSNHTLPDLVADLRGQVNIQLHGVISSKRGGLKTVFNSAPDVPVSKFILNMQGGKKSLLVNSTNTCAAPQLAVLNIKGQNNKKVVNNKFKLNISSCGNKSKGKKHKK
jgi:hypothetical protein